MPKKKTKKLSYRNAGPNNGAPRAPRPPRVKTEEETTLQRLGYTAAGAATTSLAGAFLAREGWAPKTIATALAAVGAGLGWKGDAATVRSIGAGVMSAAGSQLALLVLDEHEHKAHTASTPSPGAAPAQSAQTDATQKPANAGALPPGSLESAFERSKARLAARANA